jgi:CBS domain-containing protein
MTSIPLLSKVTLGDIIPKTQKQFITLSSNMPLSEAMKTLAEHNISSAPVRVANDKAEEYVGFIDFVDIVTYVVQFIKEDPKNLHGSGLLKVLTQEKAFGQQHIDAIVGKTI